MKFNEDSRVKIPALVHLTRLGYTYLPKKEWNTHPETNIFIDHFKQGISQINETEFSDDEIKTFISELSNQLENNDLGKEFYKSLSGEFDCKLIDFKNFDNNLFHAVTELPYIKDEEEFRPDITILINGMPLAFLDVKIPNNKEGILAERNRIIRRFKNPKFKKFINISQLLIFSNNNEYDEESVNPIQGAFYATPNPEKVRFNPFREEDYSVISNVPQEALETEKKILLDNNLISILGSPEYNTNKQIKTPTNRIISSLLSRERLWLLLKYGITYITRVLETGTLLEKHIMRYPQLFATLAIQNKLESGGKKGIIWHTQGSGKTALAYFNVHFLRDYFQKKKIIAKFYFIVDRLDLAIQAKNEFEGRDLKVEVVNSKEDFIKNIKTQGAVAGNLGTPTITVVNIQKFSEESISQESDYSLNIQRVYFLDEVHRSYNPKGSFLANLLSSDRSAILIGLTGTPLIYGDFKSKELFGDYIHKYYYNKSIADGYTLKLIREAIETTFKTEAKQILHEIETQEGSLTKKEVFAHPKYVEQLVKYIIRDFKKSRILQNDSTIGGMIVSDSSEQARAIFDEIQKYNTGLEEPPTKYSKAAEPEEKYITFDDKPIKASLILHDEGTKDTRKDDTEDFKAGAIDILVVYNMLLTGFDAERLKKLYLSRVIKQHNLLQTLTRVNRPYKDFKYGYVVDFADIQEEFDKTNKAYFKELQQELGNEVENYSNLFKSAEEIEAEIQQIRENLFLYNFNNLEEFQQIISKIKDRKEIADLKKNLENLKNLYNIIKIMGFHELHDQFSFDKVNKLLKEVNNRIDIINLRDRLEQAGDSTMLLNLALEKMQFSFKKINEHELQIADKFRDQLERTRKELERNFDKKDPRFITLYEELRRLFKKKHIEELTSQEMDDAVKRLKLIFDQANDLNQMDEMLASKYEHDAKYAKAHKRMIGQHAEIFNSEIKLNDALLEIKHKVDAMISDNHDVLNNQNYFSEAISSIILKVLEEKGIKNLEVIRFMSKTIVDEYFIERAA